MNSLKMTPWCRLCMATMYTTLLFVAGGEVSAVTSIVETFDGSGSHPDSNGNVAQPLFDLPDWNAPSNSLNHGGDGTFDLVDSYDLDKNEVGQLAVSIAGVGDIYQAIGQINRNLGPANDLTAHVRYENFSQGTLLQVQSIDTFLNFGNELGSNAALFELVGTTYESFTGNMNSIVFVDAATTLASVTPVNVIPGGGNFDSLDIWFDVAGDGLGGTNVVMNVSVNDGPLQNILNLNPGNTLALATVDFTQAANINAAIGYVGQETLAVGAADPMRTGPTLDFDHFEVTIVPEPSTMSLLTLTVIGLAAGCHIRCR